MIGDGGSKGGVQAKGTSICRRGEQDVVGSQEEGIGRERKETGARREGT